MLHSKRLIVRITEKNLLKKKIKCRPCRSLVCIAVFKGEGAKATAAPNRSRKLFRVSGKFGERFERARGVGLRNVVPMAVATSHKEIV